LVIGVNVRTPSAALQRKGVNEVVVDVGRNHPATTEPSSETEFTMAMLAP
jgi:hypothetical protein